MQMLALNYYAVNGGICNLPLTLVIVWGLVFGNKMPTMTATQLRKSKISEVFIRQLASGSHSAFLIGWAFSWIYFFISLAPVYPVSFPLVGWAAGYFCLRSLGQGNLLAIPMTFILTIVAEAINCWLLYILGRPGVFAQLHIFILPEALLNAIIAPFIYFPLRRWYDMRAGEQEAYNIDEV